MLFYLIPKEHHDGVMAWARRCVFDSEGVIIIFNDVKIDICLCWTHHTWGTFDPNADITYDIVRMVSNIYNVSYKERK